MEFVHPKNYKPRTREEILEERRQLKAKYGRLFDSVSALLFQHDPAHINFEINPDEYDIETGTILPRLRECRSEEDVKQVVHEEFLCWFDGSTAGPIDSYGDIAREIWRLWLASGLSQAE